MWFNALFTRKIRAGAQIGRSLQSCLFSLAVIIGINASVAQYALASATDIINNDSVIDKDYLIALAKKDGALSVQASFCKINDDQVATLIEKQIIDARDTAKKYHIDFDFAAWKAEAEPSMQFTQALFSQLPRSGENYEKNCTEIKAKVNARLVQKIP